MEPCTDNLPNVLKSKFHCAANLNTTDPDAIIFAPVDRAFQRLLAVSNATADQLLGDPSLLPILLNHIAITSIDVRASLAGSSVLACMLHTLRPSSYQQ